MRTVASTSAMAVPATAAEPKRKGGGVGAGIHPAASSRSRWRLRYSYVSGCGCSGVVANVPLCYGCHGASNGGDGDVGRTQEAETVTLVRMYILWCSRCRQCWRVSQEEETVAALKRIPASTVASASMMAVPTTAAGLKRRGWCRRCPGLCTGPGRGDRAGYGCRPSGGHGISDDHAGDTGDAQSYL